MTARSTLWRAALKWPRLQRLELLDVPALGIRYVNVPKTGTGTTRMQVYRQLCDLAGETLPKSVLWEHTRWVKPADMPGLERMFTFTFARNPYERLASLYRHKIAAPRNRGRRLSRLFAVYGRKFSLGMSFAEFVAAVASVPDHKAEKHFRSQTAFVFWEGNPLTDFLGRVEDFDAGWEYVCDHSKMEPIRRGYNRTSEQAPFDLTAWYDEALLALVNQRYSADLELLGYEVVTSA